MLIITRELLAKNAVKDFKEWCKADQNSEPLMITSHKLDELGDNPSPDDVDDITSAITGGYSRTTTICNECEAKNVDVVEIGEEPDYDSYTATVCKDCLLKALSLFDG